MKSAAPADEAQRGRASATRGARRATATACCNPDVWHTVQERQRAMLRLFVALGWRDLSRAPRARGRLRQPAAICSSCCAWASRRATWPASSCCPSALPRRCRRCPRRVTLMQGDASLRQAARRERRHRAAVHRVLVAARRAVPVAPGADDVALGAARAAACCGTTSRSTTRATRTCAACRWRASASCFPQAVCSTNASRWRRRSRAAVCALHPALYPVFNALPLLRTHVLAWIEKPQP